MMPYVAVVFDSNADGKVTKAEFASTLGFGDAISILKTATLQYNLDYDYYGDFDYDYSNW